MVSGKHFQITTSDETVLPVTYIERYKDPSIKRLFEQYKFNPNKDKEYFLAKTRLENIISDIICDVQNSARTSKTFFFYTAPPSSMHARGEKPEDSMRELLRQDQDWFTSIFKVRLFYLKHSKAQHLGSSRKKRLANMSDRYSISWLFRLRLWIYKPKSIHVTILDDVCSTGGTLLACKQTLENYLQKHPSRGYKKKPAITMTIQVFSIAH